MSSLAQGSVVTQVLSLIPARLHAALDAWSWRLAQQRAAERRRRAEPPAPAAPSLAEYRLRPWRD